jgi:Protein of unknown function (DUF3617)
MIANMIPALRIRRAVVFTSLSGLIASAALPLRAAERFTAGQDEIAATTDGKTQTFTHCITPDDAKGINADAKTGRELAEKAGKGLCTIRAYDVKGNTVSSTMACGDSVTTSSATYHSDSFEGDTTTTVTVGGKRLTRTAHTKGKRIGACK